MNYRRVSCKNKGIISSTGCILETNTEKFKEDIIFHDNIDSTTVSDNSTLADLSVNFRHQIMHLE